MNKLVRHLVVWLSLFACSCTWYHSKQALWTPNDKPQSPEARFVTEEDSGLSILGIFVIAEPDHYAVMMERARKKYRCGAMHLAQLDFFTDHWIIVAFPVSRLTLVCEPEAKH